MPSKIVFNSIPSLQKKKKNCSDIKQMKAEHYNNSNLEFV